jgi:multiple sugar transport system ATP-binding protein
MAGIVLEQLSKVFPGGVRAVDGIDLEIADGEFFALLGPSGCGKTTLLRTIAGLEAATSGTLRLGDRDVTRLPPGARDVAMVFQDYALFPHMTVLDNVAYPLKIKKTPKQERHDRAAETGESLSLGGLLDRRPGQLSGGQQQRAALARAIAVHPQVFLFDEPLSNLDARLRLEARTFIKRLQSELAVTTVFVTHDQAEALAMSDRMAVMEAGQIRQVGTPREVFRRPASVFVANFIGSTPMNLLPASVSDGGIRTGDVDLPVPDDYTARLPAGLDVVYGIRPEYVRLDGADSRGAVAGEVSVVEHLGTAELVTVSTAVGEVRAVVPDVDEPTVGDTVGVTFSASQALVYRAEDGALID